MPLSAVRDVNAVYEAWRKAEGDVREQLSAELLRALRRYAYAWTFLQLQDVRPDIVNWAVWKALENLEKFEGRDGATLATWFRRIVQNLCMDALREKQRKQRELSIEDLPADVVEQLAVETPDYDRQLDYQAMTAGVEPEDAILLALRAEGADEAEIAEALGIAGPTVRVRLHRLKEKLKEEAGA